MIEPMLRSELVLNASPPRRGFARYGHHRPAAEDERREVIIGAKRPDFPAEWAVQGSNLRPWD
jgi:hypothetical protein